MSEYSQGVMMDGAAILHNGVMITIDEIVSRLNAYSELDGIARELAEALERSVHVKSAGVHGMYEHVADVVAIAALAKYNTLVKP